MLTEHPDLLKRGRQNGVNRLYVKCFDRGALLVEVRRRWGDSAAIVRDRWREAELRQALEVVIFPGCPLLVRGMGYMDGGADVREFRKACIDERVQPKCSLLMRGPATSGQAESKPALQYVIV